MRHFPFRRRFQWAFSRLLNGGRAGPAEMNAIYDSVDRQLRAADSELRTRLAAQELDPTGIPRPESIREMYPTLPYSR